MWSIYFDLIHIFPTNFSEKNLFKVHSFIQIICIMASSAFLMIFSRNFHSLEISSSRNYEDSRSRISQVKFSRIFPWKCYFLKILIKRGFLIFLKNQKSISRYYKDNILRISVSQVLNFLLQRVFQWIPIIFLRKFSKSEFS